MNKRTLSIGIIGALVASGLISSAVHAALTADSQLTQQINAGVASTDIRNSSNVVVGSPSFAMSAVTTSTTAQGTSTGVFGNAAQRISVDNPGSGTTGWTLSLNATTPGTGTWDSGSSTYKYNGTTAAEGQLSVDPNLGTITAVAGGSTGVTKPAAAATFTGSTAITIMSAGGTASKVWNGYITGIGLTQTIPAAQATGSYTLNMTQTLVVV